MGLSCGSYLRDPWGRAANRCSHLFLCISDPDRRPDFYLKFGAVVLHIVLAGALFLFDCDFIEKTKHGPWYIAAYVLLFVATLVQYFVAAGTSPGYVLDAQKAVDERDAAARRELLASNSSKDNQHQAIITVDGRSDHTRNATAWTKLAESLYPQGPSTGSPNYCSNCDIIKPPRAKHCHDCGKCALQFDHHCILLGAYIGQGNHCRYWWYLCEETVFFLWTSILYIGYLKSNILKAWWADIILIFLLAVLSVPLMFVLSLLFFHSYLILTNQITYELVRRGRIQYLREAPERVNPFNEGICRNLYWFCCARSSMYRMERVLTAQELEEKSRPIHAMTFYRVVAAADAIRIFVIDWK